MDVKKELQKKAEKFKSSYNKKPEDWLFQEGELFWPEKNILFVAYAREYCVNTDENAYSLVYMFSETSESGARVYYQKFWESRPEWRKPELLVREFVSVEENDGKIIIKAKGEDGSPIELKI